MSTVSYSAPGSTEIDEVEDDLSDNEKEVILDDIYGRDEEVSDDDEEDNNIEEEENDVDHEFDITEELMEQFINYLDGTPDDEKKEYMEALEKAPGYVLNEESSPKRFLRSENYEAGMAVSRMIEYWKLRVEVFKENAFKPITLQGAMKDVVPLILEYPNLIRVLPNDDHGRSVLCIDKTNVSFKEFDDQTDLIKLTWFGIHVALQRQSTQMKGFVMLIIDRSSSWDFLKRKTIKFMSRSRDECLPMKVRCAHICSSKLFLKVVLPVIKYFMDRETRQRLQLHSSIKTPTILAELETYGLRRDNLPKTIGGNIDQPPLWINECNLIERERSRRRKHAARLSSPYGR